MDKSELSAIYYGCGWCPGRGGAVRGSRWEWGALPAAAPPAAGAATPRFPPLWVPPWGVLPPRAADSVWMGSYFVADLVQFEGSLLLFLNGAGLRSAFLAANIIAHQIKYESNNSRPSNSSAKLTTKRGAVSGGGVARYGVGLVGRAGGRSMGRVVVSKWLMFYWLGRT